MNDVNYIAKSDNIMIEFQMECSLWPNLSDLSIKLSKEVFARFGLNSYAKEIEFCVILTDSKSIRTINKQYRLKDYPTNTISFPAQDIKYGDFNNLEIQDGFLILGDVIFAYEIVKDESEKDNKSFEDHFAHLLIHGLLHLLGYDHKTDQEALEMESIEVEILAKFNIKSPYE